ncbi:MAG TPA: Arm DNA-binding domain-containing protein [Microvirga sp.]|jgi:hypothetical protein|nr:Arm DNA-binding domain-containing protein [Microvirga sp.]
MARTLNKLSARFVQTVSEVGRYSDGGNLYLNVSANGGRRWVLMYRWNGKIHEMGLGSARTVTLARAREKAAEACQAIADRRDPMQARIQERRIPTFGDLADEHIASMEPSWRNPKHREQWRMTLSKYVKPLRALAVDAVAMEHVLGVLRPIWSEKPETASRLRKRIETVLDAARAHGYRTGENRRAGGAPRQAAPSPAQAHPRPPQRSCSTKGRLTSELQREVADPRLCSSNR